MSALFYTNSMGGLLMLLRQITCLVLLHLTVWQQSVSWLHAVTVSKKNSVAYTLSHICINTFMYMHTHTVVCLLIM